MGNTLNGLAATWTGPRTRRRHVTDGSVLLPHRHSLSLRRLNRESCLDVWVRNGGRTDGEHQWFPFQTAQKCIATRAAGTPGFSKDSGLKMLKLKRVPNELSLFKRPISMAQGSQ